MFDFSLGLDLSWLNNLANQPLPFIMWHFIKSGGWALFLVAFIYGGWINFVFSQQRKFSAKQNFVMLAIDVPKNNLHTPKVMENIFTALAGAHTPLDWHEKTFKGEFQVGFSFEIVSIDGYVQFLVRTPSQFRNLVEAAVYSQYPDAQITETIDYAKEVNVTFPNDEYNLWGTDLVFVRPDYYPLRSYAEFQDDIDKEFKDPISAMLEVMNKIGPGEQLWFQIIAIPANNDWMVKGTKAINKMTGQKAEEKHNVLNSIMNAPIAMIDEVSMQAMGQTIFNNPPDKNAKPDKFNIMMMTPQQKREVEAIAEKIDKICFNCKVRYLYFGKKEVFKKGLAVSGMMGAIKQFSQTGLNGLKPGGNKTQAKLLLKNLRMAALQNDILKNYKARNPDTTVGKYIMSTNELATLYHFPFYMVKAPLVKKTEFTRAAAPAGLPVEGIGMEIPEEEPEKAQEIRPEVDYDNDYFEQRFAKDQTGVKDQERKEKVMEMLETGKAPKTVKKIVEQEKKEIRENAEDGPGSPAADDAAPGNLPVV
jgi:hypothetical protein